MSYIKETLVFGKVREERKFHSTGHTSPKRPKMPRRQKTTEEIKQNNERRAWKKLYILLNANFKRGDIRVDLTYCDPAPSPEEAKKRFEKFLRDLRAIYKKSGGILKYVAIAEHDGHRIHHHIIINKIKAIDRDEINEVWPYARIDFRSYRYFDGEPEDCERLTNYFLKETKNTFNTEKRIIGLHWTSSKNLIRPQPEREVISKADTWREPPKPPKGYYIKEFQTGTTEAGYPYSFCQMIKIGDPRKRGPS